jgi:hypothetical protein
LAQLDTRMDLNQQLNKIASDKGVSGKATALAIAALVLLDKNGEVQFDADDLPGTLARLLAKGSPNGIIDLADIVDPVNSATQASVGFGTGVGNTAILFTAIQIGTLGDDITIEFRDPLDVDQDLSVVVQGGGRAILVNLATDSDGLITSTSGDIIAALASSTLVTAVSSNGSDDTGVVGEWGPTRLGDFGPGVDPTGLGVAGCGSRFTNFAAGTLYINQGTKANPSWARLKFVGE